MLGLFAGQMTDRSAAKVRADQLLTAQGLAESRTRAQALILAGLVFSGETKLAKPGQVLAEDAPLELLWLMWYCTK